jgi:hypothetical protein
MIELRVLAVVGLLVVMIGSAVTVIAAWAVAERLRPIWERTWKPGLRKPGGAGRLSN